MTTLAKTSNRSSLRGGRPSASTGWGVKRAAREEMSTEQQQTRHTGQVGEVNACRSETCSPTERERERDTCRKTWVEEEQRGNSPNERTEKTDIYVLQRHKTTNESTEKLGL